MADIPDANRTLFDELKSLTAAWADRGALNGDVLPLFLAAAADVAVQAGASFETCMNMFGRAYGSLMHQKCIDEQAARAARGEDQ